MGVVLKEYMIKFNSQKHKKLLKDKPFSFISTLVYLDFCAYILERNEEDLIVTQDKVDKKDFPYLFLPKNKKNWKNMTASMVCAEDLEKIKKSDVKIIKTNPTVTEFFYLTKDFLNPTKKYKQKIGQFEKNYKFKIRKKYNKKKLLKFYDFWEKQKSGDKNKDENVFRKESDEFFNFCLKNLKKYNIEQIYVEVEGKLVGFVWGVKHSKNNWVSLHIKSDYKYRGLSSFLNFEISKKFTNTKLVSLGTGCQDAGLTQNKKELGPAEEKKYFYVLTR